MEKNTLARENFAFSSSESTQNNKDNACCTNSLSAMYMYTRVNVDFSHCTHPYIFMYVCIYVCTTQYPKRNTEVLSIVLSHLLEQQILVYSVDGKVSG